MKLVDKKVIWRARVMALVFVASTEASIAWTGTKGERPDGYTIDSGRCKRLPDCKFGEFFGYFLQLATLGGFFFW